MFHNNGINVEYAFKFKYILYNEVTTASNCDEVDDVMSVS